MKHVRVFFLICNKKFTSGLTKNSCISQGNRMSGGLGFFITDISLKKKKISRKGIRISVTIIISCTKRETNIALGC